ncbi:MAG: MFS transporter [Rubrobacter sp.]|jgi:MFS family permease|nr:MFS transporter [Rubrobacter sp.]
MAAVANRRDDEALDPRAKHAIRGAFLGFFVDIFDIYLPIVVLAPALIYFVSPQIGGTASTIIGASIFAATLVGRPVGALIFGRFADTIGRKRTTIVAVSGFGAITLLLALMPGYQQIGIAAVIIFIVLRFLDGIFLGGEYTSASPLAMEYSPQAKRGYYGALVMTGFPLAYATISLITMFLLFLLPSEGLNSPYVQWGWRIPFLLGAVLAFGFVVYYSRSVSESEVFEQSGGSESPLKDLFSGDNLKNFLQVFVMMTGFWLTLNTVAAVLPGLLGDPVGLSSTSVTITLVIANVILAGGYVLAGVISQRIGRRPFLIGIGLVMSVAGTLLYYVLISAAPKNLFVVIFLTTVITLLVVSPWGLATTYINERFQTGVRASGFGLGYSLAVIIPSFYAFYQAGLETFMPAEYTVLVLLVLGALLIVGGAAWGPEIRDVDFSEDARETP